MQLVKKDAPTEAFSVFRVAFPDDKKALFRVRKAFPDVVK